MKYTKILPVLLAAVLFAACLCAPAAAWHSNTDAKISPSGALMPGDTVSADITITYLRDTTVYRLPLSTSLSNQQWSGKLTRDDGTPITEFPPGKRFIDGYSITKLPYEVILTVHLEGTVPQGTMGQELTVMKVEEITSGSIVVSSYEKKSVIGTGTVSTVTPTATVTATKTSTPATTATATPTVTATATATPKPTVSTATLVISSNPAGANVFIDNNYKGFTPTIQAGISPGTHTILLKKDGYMDDTQTLKFEAGTSYDMSFTLAPKAKASEVVIDLVKEYPTASLFVVLIVVVGILILLVRRRR